MWSLCKTTSEKNIFFSVFGLTSEQQQNNCKKEKEMSGQSSQETSSQARREKNPFSW